MYVYVTNHLHSHTHNIQVPFLMWKYFHLEIFPIFPLKHALLKHYGRIFSSWLYVAKYWKFSSRHSLSIVLTVCRWTRCRYSVDTCGTILRCTEVIHSKWICFFFHSFLFLYAVCFSKGSPPEWVNENFLPFIIWCCTLPLSSLLYI